MTTIWARRKFREKFQFLLWLRRVQALPENGGVENELEPAAEIVVSAN